LGVDFATPSPALYRRQNPKPCDDAAGGNTGLRRKGDIRFGNLPRALKLNVALAEGIRTNGRRAVVESAPTGDRVFKRLPCAVWLPVGLLLGCRWREEDSVGRRGRALACLCLLVAVTGCASHHASAGVTPAALVKQAFVDVFSSKTPVALRESALENGMAFAPALTAQAKAGAMTPTIGAVTFSDSSHAAVSFSLTVASATHLPSIAGAAVLVGSSWQVSASTMCVVLSATNQHAAACG